MIINGMEWNGGVRGAGGGEKEEEKEEEEEEEAGSGTYPFLNMAVSV